MRYCQIFIVICVSISLVKQSVAQCGMRRTSRIVGGTETYINEFPMMAGLVEYGQYGSNEVFCGGTIVTNYHVLTSAHCIINKSASTLYVLVGDHNYAIGTDTTYAALYAVASYLIYPSYNSNTNQNDLAIIRVGSQIVYNAGVGPVCLPTSTSLFANEIAEGVGWGSVSFGGPTSKVLQKVQLKVVTNAYCNSYYGNIQSTQICTFTQYKDTCQKDSGGPIFYMINGRVNIIGIISYGQGCASSYPSVNTRVTSFISWIKSNAPGWSSY